jgi:hypothetical protein
MANTHQGHFPDHDSHAASAPLGLRTHGMLPHDLAASDGRANACTHRLPIDHVGMQHAVHQRRALPESAIHKTEAGSRGTPCGLLHNL